MEAIGAAGATGLNAPEPDMPLLEDFFEQSIEAGATAGEIGRAVGCI